MTIKLPISTRTQVKRLKERANYELAEICAVIDNSLMATVAFYDGENVHAIPMAIWREEDYLYIHGSNGSRLLQLLEAVLKSRKGPPKDKEGDMAQPVWAGVIPLHTQWSNPEQITEQSDLDLPGLSVRTIAI